jgi:hypothetical protein
MKICIIACVCVFLLSAVAFAQSPTPTTATTSTQALQLLQQALKALSPNITTSDVTLIGSVHYIAGSDDEDGGWPTLCAFCKGWAPPPQVSIAERASGVKNSFDHTTDPYY